MPPLILAILVGAGAYTGYRAWRRVLTTWTDIHANTGDPPSTPGNDLIIEKDLGALELDSTTGVYRPERREQ